MKPLLLILFIPLALWSQEKQHRLRILIIPDSGKTHKDTTHNIMPITKEMSDSICGLNFNGYYGDVNITTKLIFQYEKECYNDSTLDYIYGNELTVSDGDWSQKYYSRKTPFYRHKQPTFDGFIAWLHKKYKL